MATALHRSAVPALWDTSGPATFRRRKPSSICGSSWGAGSPAPQGPAPASDQHDAPAISRSLTPTPALSMAAGMCPAARTARRWSAIPAPSLMKRICGAIALASPARQAVAAAMRRGPTQEPRPPNRRRAGPDPAAAHACGRGPKLRDRECRSRIAIRSAPRRRRRSNAPRGVKPPAGNAMFVGPCRFPDPPSAMRRRCVRTPHDRPCRPAGQMQTAR